MLRQLSRLSSTTGKKYLRTFLTPEEENAELHADLSECNKKYQQSRTVEIMVSKLASEIQPALETLTAGLEVQKSSARSEEESAKIKKMLEGLKKLGVLFQSVSQDKKIDETKTTENKKEPPRIGIQL